MKLTKLHLIIILALTLILCPILGVCHNAREGFQEGNGSGEQEQEEEEEPPVDTNEGYKTDMQ
jgi:hypothetical protein